MNKWIPDRKVLAGGTVGVVAWAIAQGLAAALGVTLPEEAVTGLASLLGLAVAYWVPPSARDLVRRADETLAAIAADERR